MPSGGRPLKRFLFCLFVVGAVASVLAIRPRLAYEEALGNRVAVAANLGDIAEIADAQGLPIDQVLESFAAAGLTSVVAPPDYLAAITAQRGPVLTGERRPEWVPLLPGKAGEPRTAVDALLAGVRDQLEAGVRARLVVFAGPAMPGYPVNLRATVASLEELGLRIGLVEDPSQLGYVALPGTGDVAVLSDYSLIRVYHQPAATLYSPDRIIQKTARSVKDRSLRLVWLDLYKFPGEAPAAWLSLPTGATGSLAASLRYVDGTVESLRATGFEVEPASAATLTPGPAFSASPCLLVLLILGPWAASVLLVDLVTGISLSRPDRRFLKTMGLAAASLILMVAFSLALRVAPIAARQGAALWAAIAYPGLALAWLARRWTLDYGSAPRPGAALPAVFAQAGTTLVAATIALLGGFAVAGLLADIRFATEISYFRGVKVSYVVPPAFGFAAAVLMAERRGWLRQAWRDGLSFATSALRVWHVGLAALAVATIAVYVGRSGDQPWLPVSGLEVTVRVWLDRVLFAQPRVKEFLIGYPALMVGSYLAMTGRRRWLPVWVAAGGVGLVSIVNSFEHVRSPLVLSLMRAGNGAWLGLAIGVAAVYVADGLLGSPPAGPGRGAESSKPVAKSPRGRGAGEPADILGVRIARVSFEQALQKAMQLIRQAAEGTSARLILTPNPEFVARARRDPTLRAQCNSADLAVADGIGVVWASRILGQPLPGRVSGFDLFVALLERGGEIWSGHRPLRVFLLGGRPGVAREAAERIAAAYPGVEVVGEHHGYFADDAGPLAAIHRAQPDLVAVGLGSPKQEAWLTANRVALGSMAAMGVGGTLDVISGRTRRAPTWIQAVSLEWLYRILFEPRARLRRAPALVVFALSVLGATLRARLRGGSEKP